MKKLIVCLLLASCAFAQYSAVPSSSYPALDAIINGKVAFSSQSGAPSGGCTQGKEFNENNANGDLYVCGPSGWLLKGAAGTNGTNGTNGSAGAAATVAVGTT